MSRFIMLTWQVPRSVPLQQWLFLHIRFVENFIIKLNWIECLLILGSVCWFILFWIASYRAQSMWCLLIIARDCLGSRLLWWSNGRTNHLNRFQKSEKHTQFSKKKKNVDSSQVFHSPSFEYELITNAWARRAVQCSIVCFVCFVSFHLENLFFQWQMRTSYP